ncbi:MAG: Cellulophaga phage phi17:2 [Pseudomonadota bacterium]
MKLHWGSKDGGPESKVWVWGLESKRIGSLLLLKVGEVSREAFHTHAFHSISLVLKGGLEELVLQTVYPNGGFDTETVYYRAGDVVKTLKSRFHQVFGRDEENWVLTLRGPWSQFWTEYQPEDARFFQFTTGRKVTLIAGWDGTTLSTESELC